MSPRNQKSHLRAAFLVVSSVAIFLVGQTPTVRAETWTLLQGNNSFEAQFIGVWKDDVILQNSDGKRKAFKLVAGFPESLRGDSRIQARNMAKQGAAERAKRIEAMNREAEAATAAAPDKLPQPPPASKYTPPQKDAAIGEFIKQVNDALTGGHLRVLYDFRPESYRQDISELVKLAANKTSPETFQAIVGAPHRLGDLIVTRQNWLLSSPRLNNFPADQRVKAEWTLLGLANVLRNGLSADAIQLETLQSRDFADWLDSWDNTVAPYVAEMIQKSGIDLASHTTVKSESEGTAIISTGTIDSPVDMVMVLVDGFWVPKDTADSWASNVEQTKQQIAETADGEYLQTVALMSGLINKSLDPLEQADRPDEYHRALDAILSQPNSAEQFRQALGSMLSPIQSIMTFSAGQPDSGTSTADDDK
jgi:hypothetical protein